MIVYDIPYEITHSQLFSNSTIHVLPIYGQTDSKTAIVADQTSNPGSTNPESISRNLLFN